MRGRASVGAALVSALVVGCGGAGSNAGAEGAAPGDPSSCAPVESALTAASTLEGMAGRYRLTLVQQGNGPRAASGLLTLRDQAPGSRELAGASTPLLGFTDLSLEDVSAYPVGDPSSEDPTAPGVLVLETGGSGGRSVLLRFGSQANRRDQVRFDGAYTVLRVHHIDRDGFAGTWESGISDTEAQGHFCAVRSGA